MSDLFRNIKNRAAKSFVLLCALFLSPVLSGEVIIQPEKSAVICDKKDLGTAKMLVEHLQRISGVAPEINPSNTSGKYLFCIGKAPADKKLTGKFIDECFWFIGSDAAWFYGNTPQTTAYAVSDFLEKALAVRWPQPGVICAAPQNRAMSTMICHTLCLIEPMGRSMVAMTAMYKRAGAIR